MRTRTRLVHFSILWAIILSVLIGASTVKANMSWTPSFDPTVTIKAVLKYRHLFNPEKPGWDAILGPCFVGEPTCPSSYYGASGGMYIDLNPIPYAQMNHLTVVYDGVNTLTATLLPMGAMTPIVMTYTAVSRLEQVNYLQLTLSGQVTPGLVGETVSLRNATLNGESLSDTIGTTGRLEFYLQGIDLSGGFAIEGDMELTWPQSNTGCDECAKLVLQIGAIQPSGLILNGQALNSSGQPLQGAQIFYQVNTDPAILAATSALDGSYQSEQQTLPENAQVKVWAQLNNYRIIPEFVSFFHLTGLETRTTNFTGIMIPTQVGHPNPDTLGIGGIPAVFPVLQAAVYRFPDDPLSGVPGAVLDISQDNPANLMNGILSGIFDGIISSSPCISGVNDLATPFTCGQLVATEIAQEEPLLNPIYLYTLPASINPKPIMQSYQNWQMNPDGQGLVQGLGFMNASLAAPAADVNLDGRIDTGDVIGIGLSENWTASNLARGWKRADVNYDGIIDTSDVVVVGLVDHWLATW